MNRRAFLRDSSVVTLAMGFPARVLRLAAKEGQGSGGASQTMSGRHYRALLR